MYKAFATKMMAAAITVSLAACGGGGASNVNLSSQAAAIDQAITNIAQNTPAPAPAYSGSFCAVNGVSIGFVSGTSEDAVAMSIAKSIANAPSTNAANYKLLLSDSGLSITLFGAMIPGQKSAITGLPLYDPNVNYVAKLTSSGLVVTKV